MFNLKISLQPSRQLSLLYIILITGAIIGSSLLFIPLYYKVSLILILLVLCYSMMRQFAWLQTKRSIVTLQWLSGNQWLLVAKSGDTLQGSLLGDSFISPILMLLNFKLPNHWQSRSVLILSDSADPQILRQLRAFLRVSIYAANPKTK